jgi:hypothetical protein
LSAIKSTHYIQKLFSLYELLFNNTHIPTQCMNKCGLLYTPFRRILLTFIHHKHSFPGNITKIPTPSKISPYLQILYIKNHPLQPWLLLHLYMPSHVEDLFCIPNIQNSITQQIVASPNPTRILCGNFNRDIVLIGQHNTHTFIQSLHIDHGWRNYINTLHLSYIPMDTTNIRQ